MSLFRPSIFSLNFLHPAPNKQQVFSQLEEPIRGEIFSVERLELHAETLAAAQTVTANPRRLRRLTPRVRENGRILLEAYHAIAEAVRNQRAITPAAEWLLDNFHIIEEQIRDIRDHLPAGFYKELPKIADGPLHGYPRVYGIAWAFVAHTDSRFDPELLKRFVHAYQRSQPLTIGELWALPITLRMVMVENLRRLAVRIVGSQIARFDADTLADELLGLAGPRPADFNAILTARDNKPLATAFAVQFAQRLRYQDPSVNSGLQWLDAKLASQGVSADELVIAEHHNQAGANVSVRNIITSMRLMSAFDWQQFFEDVSLVDEVMRQDPDFSALDFVSRDRYRHAIEALSRAAKRPEIEVAQAVYAKTETMRKKMRETGRSGDARYADPGYYLISAGRASFEKELGVKITPLHLLIRTYTANPTPAYLGTILFFTLILLAYPLAQTMEAGAPAWGLLILALAGIFPASDLSIGLINRLVTKAIGPRHLPRFKLAEGVPAEFRTFVVIPTLLCKPEDIEEQIGQLEVHFLSNSEGEVYFALLSDWTDASAENQPTDQLLYEQALAGIEALNTRHGRTASGLQRFYLFHRRRLWNPREGKWMGWERKRGKLEEFNRWLQGATNTSVIDMAPPPANVKYVITLDSDTQLPNGAVRQLVGTLAHPLNRPRLDPKTRRVVEGYGILQPRITAALPSRRDRSIYQRLFSGPCGIDPYASAVSDVYQDLFREGSFTGKGIYDVDMFQTVMAGRVPENALLSHDLFEGTFARCALVSDIAFFEEFPSHSEVAASRMHRWTRGDWQLLPWILGREGGAIPAIGRWKMLDNLRRSLSPPAMLVTLLASWVIPNAPYALWTAFILLTLALPALLSFFSDLIPARGVSPRNHWGLVWRDLLTGFSHIAISVTLLAHHTLLNLDAIIRALVRLTITRRHLLEWVTAAQAKSAASLSLGSFMWRLKGAVILSIASAGVVVFLNPAALTLAAPFIALWFASPLLARTISLPPKATDEFDLSPDEIKTFRLTARRIWRFFTTFVSPEDHALPPDNFQEDPHPVVAHRTSPTNFGLYLLSVVSARQFGWIGLIDMIERIEDTLASMEALPRFRGHFYNWYETRENRALDPRYISSVDSGNLAGHLLALGEACQAAATSVLVNAQSFIGIKDTLTLVDENIRATDGMPRTTTVTLAQLEEASKELGALLQDSPQTPQAYNERWQALLSRADTLRDIARAFAAEQGDAIHSELLNWALLLHRDIESHARDSSLLASAGALEELCARYSNNPDYAKLAPDLCRMPLDTWEELARVAQEKLQDLREMNNSDKENAVQALQHAAQISADLLQRLQGIAATCKRLVDEMDFRFLFDDTRKLFSIGYRVDDQCLDAGYYDLLASEARLTSFIAIAKGDVAASHWFRLGRALTPVEKGAILISWSGSMFEYLMPSLVMFTPHGSLLDQTCRLNVQRQIQYGAENKVPWGISESAYHARDLAFTYQYSNFGIPGLGLKRGLGQDLVISPYATLLAAMYDPQAAVANLKKLTALGGRGIYGFYEALDFTRSRLPEDQDVSIIKAYMAHHQGMSLVSIANVIYDGIIRRYFHSAPLVQASELLLQERTPRNVAVARPRADQVEYGRIRDQVDAVLRRFYSPHTAVPASHLLSNGRYAVMFTAAGSGYSRWQDLAVTRWREDVTRDAWGSYFYLRDTASGEVWSAGYQPTAKEPDHYEVIFTEDRARIVRQDGSITTSLEIIVSSEDDAEIRRISVANNSLRVREIEITSYTEIVLTGLAADIAHPAFSNLFVQTEFLPEVGGLLAARRPRSHTDAAMWAGQVLSIARYGAGGVEYETDRNRFLGRNRGNDNPISIMDGRPLSNTIGPVLDPVFSLRARLRVPPGATAHISYSTFVANSREEAVDLADKYHDPAIFERASTLAWTQAQVQLHYLGIEPEEAHLFQHLANRLLYSDPTLRPSSEILKRNELSVSGLWAHSISGDYPIILVRIDDTDDKGMVRQLLRAHEYWRMKRLYVDLIILNERTASYAQDLQNLMEGMVRSCGYLEGNTKGGVTVLRADLLTVAERDLLQTAARAILLARQGNLSEQVTRMRRIEARPELPALESHAAAGSDAALLALPALSLFNGLGGFSENGKEYVTYLGRGQRTPAPWINVIANAHFGFHVSESGSGYTWAENSRENQISPWANDPVSDPPGEAFYIYDEESRELWSPTALPIRLEATSYIAHHGHGYSRFEHLANGIYTDLVQFVPLDDPIKISRLILHNRSARPRRIALTSYLEWVLGFSRTTTAPFITTEIDPDSGAMLARNPWHNEFGRRVAFAHLSGGTVVYTADRTEFLGRNGHLSAPGALVHGKTFSKRVGAGIDPCCAMQTSLTLNANESKEVVFFIGQCADKAQSLELIQRYRRENLDAIFQTVVQHWQTILQKVQVKTPDKAMDLVLNSWLLYQTIACRIIARAAFYQAGGAYGFRDQLQDAMAQVISQPELARAHILRAAARQFVEGDVQHWWHPPSGRGVRTHFSDDLLWLPFVTAHYIAITGDLSVLDAQAGFIEGPLLAADEEDRYFEPTQSAKTANIFEHCAMTLDRSLKVGAHGLPLIGAGDWNDGMNRVGHGGAGESVWLAWFLISALGQFVGYAKQRGELQRAQTWLAHIDKLKVAVEANAWDGAWYRRAYFDDGTPLGSASNAECRIDSIAQSWSILSGAAEPARARRAMEAVEEYLIRPGDDLILLFQPPFDKTTLDPGYIKGYLPGVRENGGQYSHAAIWLSMAYARLGNGDRATQLFAMLNPINHACTRTGVHRYKVEPYVIAADIYAEPPHVGRGGWTWYTGSAGWMYRAGIESILGLLVRGNTLEFDPCIPRDWKSYQIFYRHQTTEYEITVVNPHGISRGIAFLELDDVRMPSPIVPLKDDGKRHQVKVTLGGLA